ncbi:ATP-binding protein [Lysobacter niabensis]|uniref:hybrid sensor histidine kinase/response regulator n=1 Tax=Agrilutibacter niabensis TaxID=380628 RepID=UPI0036123114
MNGPVSVGRLRQRVLLIVSTVRDAELTRDLLGRHNIDVEVCVDAAMLEHEMRRGVGAVLIAEEMLGRGSAQAVLAHALERQPHWSDLPVLVLSMGGADSLEIGDAIAMLGNVIVLERPLRVAALLSSVRAALRARHRQYEIENHLRQLERARDAEATTARRKDEFLAMLAHELRNPLAPIRNALYLLNADDSDGERRVQMRAMMLRQVEHMVRLVDDLLDASRLSRGMITLHREPVDLHGALRAAIDLSQPLLEAGGFDLQMRLSEGALPVDADPVRIAQVFGNLLNNAAKYGRPGGHIAVTARREGDTAVVQIEDDGHGIDPGLLPYVFELFVQGGRSGDSTHQGLGIGLALVRDLVRLHGGNVVAESEGEGRGSRFTVILPLARTATVEAQPAPRLASLEGLRVLVVDDNVDAATSMAMVLETLSAEHAVAHDGPSALAMIDRVQPHVVLLDIGMRGMDGYELARAIRLLPQHADTLLIAVSGWSQNTDLLRSREAGIDHHLAKPVDIAQLMGLLRQVRNTA